MQHHMKLVTFAVALILLSPFAAAIDRIQTEVIHGPYGMKPWGSAGGFLPNISSWVWNTPGAEQDAPVTSVLFGATYFNPFTASVNATLHFMADNIATVYLNSVEVGSVADHTWRTVGTYPQMPIQMTTGLNIFIFNVTNILGKQDTKTNNPAGMIYAVIGDDDGVTYLNSGTPRLNLASVLADVVTAATLGTNAQGKKRVI